MRLDPGDMVLAFSDGATEVQSPDGVQLSPTGFLDFAHSTLTKLPAPRPLPDFSKSLLAGIHEYRGHSELDDDITLLTLRRVAANRSPGTAHWAPGGCAAKYCSKPALTCVTIPCTFLSTAAATAPTSFPLTGSSCE